MVRNFEDVDTPWRVSGLGETAMRIVPKDSRTKKMIIGSPMIIYFRSSPVPLGLDENGVVRLTSLTHVT